MKHPSVFYFILFAVFSGGIVLAQETQTWSGSCNIQFSGNSTLHQFSGKVSADPFTISVSNPTDLAKATAKGKVKAKASKLDTAKPARDKKMHKVLGTGSYPDVIVNIGTLAAAATKPKTGGAVPQPTVIPFDLTIKGTTRKTVGQVSSWSYSDKKIRFQVSFPVSLTSFGIKPPSVVGIVKVEDTIQVVANVSLNRK